MITKTKKQPIRLDHDKLNVISESLVDRMEDVFDIFSIDYNKGRKMYYGTCPVHNGDNDSAFNMYYDGAIYKGNWRCRTHGCEYVFKKTPIGFIRGLLSRFDYSWTQKGDKIATFAETTDWVSRFLKKDLSKIQIDKPQVEKKRFINSIAWTTGGIQPNKRCFYLKQNVYKNTPNIVFPSAYFLNRGFKQETLTKYDVGDYIAPNREMSGRAVIPVYDDNYKHIVGVTGRAIQDIVNRGKWEHNASFPAEELLFNFWFARDHINHLKSVVLCESPLNVLRLEEAGIHNAVALFGVNLSDIQLNKLFQCEIYTINLLLDNDEAGRTGTENIVTKLNRIFDIKVIKIPDDANDVAELPIEKVKELIIPQIKVY